MSKLACSFPKDSRSDGKYKTVCKECDNIRRRTNRKNRTPDQIAKDKSLKRDSDNRYYTAMSNEQKEKRRLYLKEHKRKKRLQAGIVPKHTSEYKLEILRRKELRWLRTAQKADARSAFKYWIMEKASTESVDAYYIDKPWNNPRLSPTEKYKLRYNTDPEFNLKERLRRQLNKKRRGGGVASSMRGAIKRNGNSSLIERLCGYTIVELKSHLEKQFTKGMDWKSFNKGEIHIDHITPIKDFNLKKEQDFKQCWSLSNLMPLWAKDNLSKSGKQYYLI